MTVDIELSSDSAVIDERLTIRVRGLEPGRPVTVSASVAMRDRCLWSYASFVARPDGTVDLSTDAPVAGTYTGVDAMGLFWSVGPRRRSPHRPAEGGSAILSATVDGSEVAIAQVRRRWARPDLEVVDVRERGLVGRMYRATSATPGPAVLVLGGSEGGLGGWTHMMAAGLATHGLTALSLAYFRTEGLPPRLSVVPLEYFERALEWLGEDLAVDPSRLAVMGASRGGELALLLGATFPMLRAVVAYAPSHVVWSEIAFGFRRRRSSWSHKGRPLPFVDMQLPMGSATPARVLDSNPDAVIPVERINGAVLAVSGMEDTLWPSSLMADRVMDRLAHHRHRFPFEHLKYPGVGHGITRPYVVTGGLAHGGTAAGAARANEHSWEHVRSFLHANLAT
jgi:dienelactone hydrolase